MDRNGAERTGMELNGLKWNRLEWTGQEWNGMGGPERNQKGTEMDRNRVKWTGRTGPEMNKCMELEQTRTNRNKTDRNILGPTGMYQNGPERMEWVGTN